MMGIKSLLFPPLGGEELRQEVGEIFLRPPSSGMGLGDLLPDLPPLGSQFPPRDGVGEIFSLPRGGEGVPLGI